MNTNDTHNTSPDEQPMLPFDPPLEFEQTAVPQTPDVATLIAENESLKRAARERDARDQISSLLRSAGARSPDLMFDAVKRDLRFANDGRLENAESLVSELRTTFPEQFGSFSPQPSIDGGAGSRTSSPALTKETLARMKPADISRLNWDDVRQVLATK